MSWTNAKIKSALTNLHRVFCDSKLESRKFNFSYVERNDSALASHLSRRKIPWKKALQMAELSYDHHRGQMNYGSSEDERLQTFRFLLTGILREEGVEALSDGAMNSSFKINLPLELQSPDTHTACVDKNCQLFAITKRSIYAQGRRFYGEWPLAVQAIGLDYEQDVLRKVASRPFIETVQLLDNFDKDRNGIWSFQNIRDEDQVLERAIWNSFKKSEKVPFSGLSDDKVFVVWLNVLFLRKHGRLADVQSKEEVFEDDLDELKLSWEEDHKAQDSWSESKIIAGLHGLYSRGQNFRISRDYVGKYGSTDDKKHWAAMRQNRFRKDLGYTEEDWLLKAGIIPRNLQKLYDELAEPYTDAVIFEQLSRLMAESISNSENRLTREYCSLNEKELADAIIRRYKSWERGLRRFGLDPKFFSITASKRTRRGFLFQTFVRELFQEFGLVEGDLSKGYVHNKRLLSCKHDTKCQPDFFFSDKIIDTKTGWAASQKPEQLKRYYEHSGRVILLLLRDKSRVEVVEGVEVEVINFADFVKCSHELIGVQLPDEANQRLSETLRQEPFWT